MRRSIRRKSACPCNCNIRYDSVNQHAADLLEKAGCYGAAVGLESGNEEIREIVIKKRSKNDHIVEGARLLREKGIKVLTTNMIGLPGETLDNALETVELNMVLKSDYVRANTFLLFPGLPLVEYARQNGYIDKDFDIEKQVAESQEITLKTPYAREFRNIASLFWLMVKCPPSWMPFLSKRRLAARQRPVPHHRLVQHGARNCSSTGCARSRRSAISRTRC